MRCCGGLDSQREQRQAATSLEPSPSIYDGPRSRAMETPFHYLPRNFNCSATWSSTVARHCHEKSCFMKFGAMTRFPLQEQWMFMSLGCGKSSKPIPKTLN